MQEAKLCRMVHMSKTQCPCNTAMYCLFVAGSNGAPDSLEGWQITGVSLEAVSFKCFLRWNYRIFDCHLDFAPLIGCIGEICDFQLLFYDIFVRLLLFSMKCDSSFDDIPGCQLLFVCRMSFGEIVCAWNWLTNIGTL